MRTPLVLLLGLVTSALAPPATGQLTEKQAAAQVKAGVKSAIKQFKADLKLEAAALQLGITSFEADIGMLDASDLPVDALFDKLVAYQSAVRIAWSVAQDAAAAVATDVWAQLIADGGDPAAVLGLTVGDGGALDEMHRQMHEAAELSAYKLSKRLKKAIAEAANGSILNLRVRLDTPLPPRDVAPQAGGFSHAFYEPVSIDLLMGTSRDGVEDDGNLRASGTGNQFLVEVLLEFGSLPGLYVPVEPTFGRWSANLGLDPGMLDESNWILRVSHGDDESSVFKTIGTP